MKYRLIYHAEENFAIVQLEENLDAKTFATCCNDLVHREYWKDGLPIIWDVRKSMIQIRTKNQALIARAIMHKMKQFKGSKHALFIDETFTTQDQKNWKNIFSDCILSRSYDDCVLWLKK